MAEFTADIVIHRCGHENRYLSVTRKARQVFLVLPGTLGVPCAGASWQGQTLCAPADREADVARIFLRDFGLTIGEAVPDGEDW